MPAHPLVYELNTRCWLFNLSRRERRPIHLGNIPPDQFSFWQRSGFTHIWLMGVWTAGPLMREASAHWGATLPDFRDEDAAPSPYAVIDYTVADAFGGPAALQQFRRRLHEHGLGLILDFVPNHTSSIHPWTKKRRDLYVQTDSPAPGFFKSGSSWIAHGKDPYFPPWNDTAQIDHRNPAARSALIAELRAVAAQCDGARCDMSMLVLNDVFAHTWKRVPSAHAPPAQEFWTEAIAAVRHPFPDFLFLAEAYWDLEQRLLDLGFDYAYDKRVYDHLAARNAAALREHLTRKPPSFLARSCHFLENHDEPRAASIFDPAEHRAASLLTLALPGMRLLHEGQLAGAKLRASVHLRRRPPEPADESIASWYDRLLRALINSAVGRGDFEILNGPADHVTAVRWQARPAEFYLAVANLANSPARFEMHVNSEQWRQTNLLEPEPPVHGSGPLRVDLPPHAACLLRIQI